MTFAWKSAHRRQREIKYNNWRISCVEHREYNQSRDFTYARKISRILYIRFGERERKGCNFSFTIIQRKARDIRQHRTRDARFFANICTILNKESSQSTVCDLALQHIALQLIYNKDESRLQYIINWARKRDREIIEKSYH